MKTLVVGFGNAYRRDDGVGFVVVNTLRARLGRPPLDADDDGYGDQGHETDTLVLHQLVPEMAEHVSAYDLVVFVDAHVGSIPDPVREEQLEVCYRSATVSHQLHPCTVLAMAQEFYGRCPRGVLLSILGRDFEFGEGLSEQTAELVPQVLDRVLALAAGGE